jgi:hypothetical protein
MITHTVSPGECLASIAERYGFTNPRVVYDHPANEALRAARPDPNVLLAGDQVAVPERQVRTVTGATEQRHRFVVDRKLVYLRLRLLDGAGKPRAGLPYRVEYQGQVLHGTTDGDGTVVQVVPAYLSSALVMVKDQGRDEQYKVALGYLDPMTSESGLRQRLANLGYILPVDAVPADIKLRFATHSFQVHHGLPVTGVADDATRQKILEAHGS